MVSQAETADRAIGPVCSESQNIAVTRGDFKDMAETLAGPGYSQDKMPKEGLVSLQNRYHPCTWDLQRLLKQECRCAIGEEFGASKFVR